MEIPYFSSLSGRPRDIMYIDNIEAFSKMDEEMKNMIQKIEIFCQNIGKEFGLEKCVIFVIKVENNRRNK